MTEINSSSGNVYVPYDGQSPTIDIGLFENAAKTEEEAQVNAKNIIKDSASQAAVEFGGKVLGVYAASNPEKAEMIGPTQISTEEIDGIKNRIAEIVNTPPSEIGTPNKWLASNPFVNLRMLIFEAVAMLSAVKALEKKLEINAMNMMWDMAVVKAGLIIDAAETEAMMNIVTAVASGVMAFASMGNVGSMMNASKGSKVANRDAASMAHDYGKVAKNNDDMAAIGGNINKTPDKPTSDIFKDQKRIDELKADLAATPKPTPLNPEQEKALAARASNSPVDNPPKVDVDAAATKKELIDARNAKETELKELEAKQNAQKEYNEKYFENQEIFQKHGIQNKDNGAASGELKESSTAAKEHASMMNQQTQTDVQLAQARQGVWQGLTQALDYASKAVFTVQKAQLEAAQQYADASMKIAEKMMNSASSSYKETAQLIDKMLDDLTKAVSANFQAHSMNK